MISRSDLWTYNPSMMPREELLDTMVGRDQLVSEIIEHVRGALQVSEPTRHILLWGPRGIGKTTVLRALQYRLREDALLSRRIIPIAFSEEEHGICSTQSFLARVISLSPSEGHWPPKDYQRSPSYELIKALEEHAGSDRAYLLMPENLPSFLSRIVSHEVEEAKRFFVGLFSHRSFLFVATALNEPQTRGKTPKNEVIADIRARFEPRRLEDLTFHATEIIRRRAARDGREELLSQPEVMDRIQAVASLSSGNPRYLVELYGLLALAEVKDIEEEFSSFLNRSTAAYQGLIEHLTPAAAAALRAIAERSGLADSAQVADAIRYPDESARKAEARARNALDELKDAALIVESKGTGRRKDYRIDPPALQLWYEMRYLDESRQRLWLLRFFQKWTSPQDTYKAHLQSLKEGSLEALDRNQPTLAIKQFRDLLYYAHMVPNWDTADAIESNACALANQGRWQEAAQALRDSRVQAESLNNRDEAVMRGIHEAWCLRSAGRVSEAREVLAHVRKLLSAEDQNTAVSLEYYLAEADLADDISDHRTVREKLAVVEAILARLPDDRAKRRWQVRVHCLAGIACSFRGQIGEAIEHQQRALAISREIGDRRTEGNSLGNLGNEYFSRGEVRKAIEYHEHALVISQEIGNRYGEAADLGNLGNAYFSLGEIRKAIEYYEQTLAVFDAIEDRANEARVEVNLAVAYLATGEIARSEECLRAAAGLAESGGFASLSQSIHEVWAKGLAGAERFDEALPKARRALEFATSAAGGPDVTRVGELLLAIMLDLVRQHLTKGDTSSAGDAFVKTQEVAALLPDDKAAELLIHHILQTALECGEAARAHLLREIEQVITWGRPEIARRLEPAVDALACQDESQWSTKNQALPPGKREAAQSVWEAMHAGHELATITKLINENHSQEALARADAFLARHPGDPRVMLLSLFACANVGDRAALEARVRKAVEQCPQDASIQRAAAVHLEALGRREEALVHARRAAELAPHDLAAQADYAGLLRKTGQYAPAAEAFRRAVVLDPKGEQWKLRLEAAEALLLTGDAETANRVLEGWPENAPTASCAVRHWLRVCSCLLRQDRAGARAEVSQFVRFWASVPANTKVEWQSEELIAEASRHVPAADVAMLRDMLDVARGAKPLVPLAIAYGQREGVQRVLDSLSAIGQAGLRQLESGLVDSLSGLGQVADRSIMIEAFFDALERDYGSLSDSARATASALFLDAIAHGLPRDKLAAMRAAGGHLVEFTPASRQAILEAMLARAEDDQESPDVRDLSARILTLAYYDLAGPDRQLLETRLRALGARFRPPALLEFLSDLQTGVAK